MTFAEHLSAMTVEQRSDVLLTLAGYADTRPEEPVGTALMACVLLLTSGVRDAAMAP